MSLIMPSKWNQGDDTFPEFMSNNTDIFRELLGNNTAHFSRVYIMQC